MKIEVRCTDCEGAWLVDEASLEDVLCPTCLRRLSVPGSREPAPVAANPPGGVAASAVETLPAVSEAAARAAPAVVGVADVAPVSAEQSSADEVVVCPRCKLHFHPSGPAARAQSDLRRTVLIIDDLGYFRETAQEALSPRYIVKTAQNTGDALAILAAGGIDLIVLDLTLDGCEDGRLFLTGLSPKPCPVLIYTTQDESELYGDSWEELSRLGADDLVLKGMNLGENLARKVGNLLGQPVDDDSMD